MRGFGGVLGGWVAIMPIIPVITIIQMIPIIPIITMIYSEEIIFIIRTYTNMHMHANACICITCMHA